MRAIDDATAYKLTLCAECGEAVRACDNYHPDAVYEQRYHRACKNIRDARVLAQFSAERA